MFRLGTSQATTKVQQVFGIPKHPRVETPFMCVSGILLQVGRVIGFSCPEGCEVAVQKQGKSNMILEGST